MAAFEQLISPLTSADFYKDFWRKQPLHISKQPLQDLLSIEEIYSFFDKNDLIYPFVRIINGGVEYPSENYLVDDTFKILNKSTIFDRFSKGDTIVIQRAHLQFENLKKFTFSLEKTLNGVVNANIYITPAHSAGFYPHFDSHEVFTTQVAGFKLWNIYDIPFEAPLKSWKMSKTQQNDYIEKRPLQQVKLDYGDVLYLPRGVIHDAFTQEEPSIHITFGVTFKTRIDLIKDFVYEIEKNPFFRHYHISLNDDKNNDKELVNNIILEMNSYLLSKKAEKSTNKPVIGIFELLFELENCTKIADIIELNLILSEDFNNKNLTDEDKVIFKGISEKRFDDIDSENENCINLIKEKIKIFILDGVLTTI